MRDFQYGVGLQDCGSCQIFRNTIHGSKYSAIELSGASYWNNIQGNIITNGGTGIVLSGTSESTTVVNNIVERNDVGIEIKDMSKDNTITKNAFIDNDRQYGDFNNQENRWNGDYDASRGNYWSDFVSRFPEGDSSSGENQNQPGSDGIWDHPYYIYGSSVYD
jgi:parallel beta-helix repeat protein